MTPVEQAEHLLAQPLSEWNSLQVKTLIIHLTVSVKAAQKVIALWEKHKIEPVTELYVYKLLVGLKCVLEVPEETDPKTDTTPKTA